jgi:spore coat polysaccharide biosynthesis protein SpsF
MKIVAILQARLNSTRLPRKVLLPLGGKPMVQQIVERVRRSTLIDSIVLAVPRCDVETICARSTAWACYIEAPDVEEHDLIGRYISVMEGRTASVIVRIPCDNPCIDPVYIDQAVQSYLHGCYPFYTNTTALTTDYVAVDGIGCEVVSYNRLQWLDQITKGNPTYREHPHQWFFDHGIVSLPKADVRLDVNTQADYEFIKDIYDHVPPQFTTDDVLAYLATKEVRT